MNRETSRLDDIVAIVVGVAVVAAVAAAPFVIAAGFFFAARCGWEGFR